MGRHQQRGTAGENQHQQEEIIVHREGLFQKNHTTTTSQVTAELNIHLDTVRGELLKSNIHGMDAILNL
jgi:hypothetical protein